MAKKQALQDRIKDIQGYFKGIEIKENLYIIKINYPEKWEAYASDDGKIRVVRSDNKATEWFYYADINDVELDDIFNLIDNTIETNETIRLKVELMHQKMSELKDLFQHESLERLRNLRFDFDKPKRNKRIEKKIEAIKEEIAEINSQPNTESEVTE